MVSNYVSFLLSCFYISPTCIPSFFFISIPTPFFFTNGLFVCIIFISFSLFTFHDIESQATRQPIHYTIILLFQSLPTPPPPPPPKKVYCALKPLPIGPLLICYFSLLIIHPLWQENQHDKIKLAYEILKVNILEDKEDTISNRTYDSLCANVGNT